MSEKLSFEDLKKKGQGLQEAITIASKYEELMQAMIDAPGDKELIQQFEALSPQTADIQKRFEPHLSTLGLMAAQLNVVQSKLEDNYKPTGGDLSVVTTTLANLESEYRVVNTELDAMDKWVSADRGDLLLELEALAASLENVRNIFKFSNVLAASTVDGDVFRQTVITLLAATIEELKAPALNVGRLKGIGETLKRVLRKSAEKKLGEAVDGALDEAVGHADKVIDLAKDLPGIENLL